MIALIDYGLGNINAFANIYTRLNIPFKFARTAEDLENSSHLILPGVGTFDYAMEKIEASGMRTKLDQLVLKKKLPILGVCVGMQIMAQRSEEGNSNGLGWFDTEVIYINKDCQSNKKNLPHMGWNEINIKNDSKLFHNLKDNSQFYFLHSYYFFPNQEIDVLAFSNYGFSFPSAIRHENIYGVQFHPEKSHCWGIELLKNFSQI
jgi:glutamine amidotransferase